MSDTGVSARAQAFLDFATASNRRAFAVLTLVALVFFLPGFFTLPPMDRDEPRFAQASRQMLESGDFVDIRFQYEARHKKPVGIYWMQAGVVATAEALGMRQVEARNSIWLYRLPSLAGAVLAVLATFWTALAFTQGRAAFLAALLMAATILLGVEARLAKTDAVVTATVVASMGVFARAWLGQQVSLAQRALFWTAMAVGVLVKGPITPMIPLFAGLALGLWQRRWDWLRALSPLAGIAWMLLLVAPWFVLIALKTGGSFFSASVGGDMLGKVASGQEAHGAPPGLYLVLFWATAWPMAPFAALAAAFAFRLRRDPAVAFLLAWIIPAWLLFEAVPTKLPHYVLPLYPAIVILTGLALERGGLELRALWARLVLFLVPLIGAIIALAGAGLWFWQDGAAIAVAFASLAGLVWALGLGARRAAIGGAVAAAMVTSVAAAMVLTALVYQGALGTRSFSPFALSPRLAEAWRDARLHSVLCASLAPATTGYREPSLVFLTETGLVMTDGEGAARFLMGERCRIAFVEARDEAVFLAKMPPGIFAIPVTRLQGVNLNGGKPMDIGLYVHDGRVP